MNVDNEQSFLPPLDIEKKLKHYVQTVNMNVHHFYVYGVIEDDITMYSDLLNVLRTSSENDVIIIYINSEGGSLRMALQISNAILSTPAKVITSLDGEACSAATLLFLAGHEYIVNPNCTFMIHFYSGGAWGKGHELESRINHLGSHVKKVMVNFYEKLLTKSEIDDVVSGRDIYMDSEELLDRLDKMDNVTKKAEELGITKDAVESKQHEPPLEKKKASKKKKVSKKKTKSKKVLA